MLFRTSTALTALFCALATLTAVGDAQARGLLIPTDESLPPLRLKSHEVAFTITDNAAVTNVTQVFENNTPQNLEATYYFAVPPGSVTTDFALWMNGERIRGEVLPRDQARRTYEAIVARMRDPGLLEYVDGELFQARIFPIPPHGEQRVEISFANVLRREGNLLHYKYPIHASAAEEIPQLLIAGDVRTSNPITNIYSPYHELDSNIARGGRSARVTMEQNRASVERDFELFIGQSGDDLGFSLLTHQADDGEDGYFMLTLAPSTELSDLSVLPKQVTFVVDTSGSMAGQKMEQAREALRHCVDNLNDDDTFQIIGFASSVNAAFNRPVSANRANRRTAHTFIDELHARGNTNISGALDRALQDPASPERPHAIVFVTDGLPTEGDRDVESILRSTATGVSDGDRRVFSFGVGYDVNTRLLDGIARRGRGEAGYVRPAEDISDIIGPLFDSIGSPLLTQIEIDFGAARVSEIYPNPLPDLYRDRDVTVFGRFRADQSVSVVVHGLAADRRHTLEYGTDFSPPDGADTSFVGNLWARRRVDALLDELDEQGHSQRRVDEIVRLATEWGIVTPYTSYLALEPGTPLADARPTDNRPTPRRVSGNADSIGASAPQSDESFVTGLGGSGGAAGQGRGRGGGPGAADMDRAAYDGRASSGPPPSAAPRAARAQVGRDAVEESIARNEARTRTTVAPAEAPTSRRVAGRSFALEGGVWVEGSVGRRAVDVRIRTLSEEYFALARENAELREILALGDRVRFEHRGRVYEVAP